MTARTLVQNIRDMTDEQFLAHWNKRHWDREGKPLGEGRSDNETIISLHKTFHDTQHRLEVGEVYDHEHKH